MNRYLVLKIWSLLFPALVAGLVEDRLFADYDYVANSLPKEMEGVRVDERLGAEDLPLDLRFRTHSGQPISLKEVLGRDKPVILTLNYSNCPGLCVAQLNGLLRGLNEVNSLSLGRDFQVISISIDPRESTQKAAGTQKRYSQDLFKQHHPEGWEFWTGESSSIAKLADSVGFRYTYDAKHDQYNHPATAIFISPDGRITRYLYELGLTGNTLKMAIVEAGEGRVGSSMDMIALWCVHYDAMENRYSSSARRLLSIAAGIFVAVGLTASIPFWFFHRNRTARGLEAENSDPRGLAQVDLNAAETACVAGETNRRTTSDTNSDTIQQ
ncbi:MAG: SCO family protein [Planctomycetes bacterium]|nr:SCO family protein [Planctomycetota bacterium]